MGVMSADENDVPLDFEAIRKTGCLGLDPAALTVMDDQTSMVNYLYNTLAVLRPRELRPVHPLPRGDDLDVQDLQADQGRRRTAGGPRRPRSDGRQHGPDPRDHHLRPGRRRRLADQERDGQVPARDGRVHPDPPGGPADGLPAPEGDRRRGLRRRVQRVARDPAGPAAALRSPHSS